MSQNRNRLSINSQKSIDFEFLAPLNPPLSTKNPIKHAITIEIPQKPLPQNPETSLKLSQLSLLNNKNSMKSSLVKLQASESNQTRTKGSISSRFSKNRESVVHYFSLLKPEQIKQSIFKRINNEIDRKRNSFRDFLTNEQLFEIALHVLQKPLSYRNANDIKLLVRSTENIAFFQTMIRKDERETHEQCCKYMTYKRLKAEETVFSEGSVGTSFYIILKGAVSIYISEEKLMSSEEKSGISPSLMKKAKKKPEFSEEKTKENILSPIIFEKVQENSNERVFLEKKIKTLTMGASFGELALMEKKPRAATIRCDTESHFAILEKEYFNWILKEKEEKNLFQQIEFLVAMKLFASWSYNAVKKLFLSMEQLEFQKDKYVYKENEPGEYMYIIKTGEFKLLKTVSYLKKPENLRKELETLEYKSGNYALSCLKNPQLITKSFEISILQKGEYFGEEELFYAKNQRKNSVFCASGAGILFRMSKEEFQKRMVSDEQTFAVLQEQITLKNQFLNQRIQQYKKTARKMQQKTVIQERIAENCNDFLFEKRGLSEKNQKKALQRVNLVKSLLNSEEIIKTMKNNISKNTEIRRKTITLENSPKNPRLLSIKSFKILPKTHKKLALSLNSFYNMPINSDSITEFLINKDLLQVNPSFPLNSGFRSVTAKKLPIKTSNFFEEFKINQRKFGEKEAEEFFDLPLKYQSEHLKASHSKKILKKYLQNEPIHTEFLQFLTLNKKFIGINTN